MTKILFGTHRVTCPFCKTYNDHSFTSQSDSATYRVPHEIHKTIRCDVCRKIYCVHLTIGVNAQSAPVIFEGDDGDPARFVIR